MLLRKGNMWKSEANLILFTGNSTIRKDGALVMGRGAALQTKQIFPGIEFELGKKITLADISKPYGVIICETYSEPEIGVFQVKRNWRDDADTNLIRFSCIKLAEVANSYKLIALNFPGIGYGRLKRNYVIGIIISYLPDNVEVWEYNTA
jgi:hypothetical protein